MNFSNNMANNKYCVQATGHYGGGANDMGVIQWETGTYLATSSAEFYLFAWLNGGTVGPGLYDAEEAMILIFGD